VLILGLFCGLFGWVLYGPVDALVLGLLGSLVAALSFKLSFREHEIDLKTLPNEGIHRSARNAFVVGLLFAVIVWLGLGSLWWQTRAPMARWFAQVLVSALTIGWIASVNAGGRACITHYVLRFWLIRKRSTPWNYVRFLDHAAECVLLRKVGGGYAFIHKLLAEHLAARYVASLGSGDDDLDETIDLEILIQDVKRLLAEPERREDRATANRNSDCGILATVTELYHRLVPVLTLALTSPARVSLPAARGACRRS
jgi:hypothetical protein